MANGLVRTSLWGIDSHGVARLPHYLNRVANRTINARPRFRFSRTAAATGVLDGDHGLGISVLHAGMERAIRLAKRSGVGVVGIVNSSHCGSIGLYTRQAAAEGMIGISFTHTDSLLQTYGGSRAFFGTNPISIAFPWPSREPLCVDMATSIVPWNKVQNAKLAGTSLPAGWAVDENGNDCTDPRRAVAVKPMGAHKGYALSFIIDMLCGPLNGMAFGPHIVSMYGDLGKKRRLGSLVMAIDPARFPGGNTLAASIRRAIREVTSEGRTVLYPGQPEYIARRRRTKSGIPVPPSLQAEFETWSRRLRIVPPRYRA